MIIGLVGHAICLRLPSKTDVRLVEESTKPLAELIAIAQAGVSVNPDLYVASTYPPEHPLYKALLAIQQKRWRDAADELKPMAERGDPDAMYWYAEMHYYHYSSNAFSERGEWFVKAAELGNPYAAMRLDPKQNIHDCNRQLRGYCTEQWGKVALKLLQQRAEQGDVKAAYAYLYYTRFEDNSYEYLDKLIKVVKQGIEQHYYRPLRYLVYMYKYRRHLSPFKGNKVIPLSEQEKQQLAQLLMIAINNNDFFATHLLSYYLFSTPPFSDSHFTQSIARMLPISDHSLSPIVRDYFINEAQYHRRDFVIQGLAYALLFDFYEDEEYHWHRHYYIRDMQRAGIRSLSEREKERAIALSEQYKKQTTALLYIDEVRGIRSSMPY